MFYVYVLISLKDRKLYIGQTNDLNRRLQVAVTPTYEPNSIFR